MARKNPFANLLSPEETPSEVLHTENRALDYATKGASRAMLHSIGELAANADKLLEGETIVELDPALIDASFAKDRISLNNDEYREEFQRVLDGIRERGQDTPVLVRPHPQDPGRYMLVFGHLRRRAAAELGRKVRAVVRQMTDRDHVIAQGQENNSRANTSFIEKAIFASEIVKRGFDDDNATAMAALGADKSTLSKMLAVAGLPTPLLDAIGRARRIGRDRWYDLKQQLDMPGQMEMALDFVRTAEVVDLSGDEKFDALVLHLKRKKPVGRGRSQATKANWAPADGRLVAETVSDGKKYTLALKARGQDARAFGDYLTERLDSLYEDFRQRTDRQENGE
ncbi:MAG: plasmid partitioning protein RepB [Pelagibacterium sp. SCN 64-44]|nr:MAG: plasmid partitioning protein RepB [Pelagibacterium sp. SCN 64-44]